jgi:hypothetical protein
VLLLPLNEPSDHMPEIEDSIKIIKRLLVTKRILYSWSVYAQKGDWEGRAQVEHVLVFTKFIESTLFSGYHREVQCYYLLGKKSRCDFMFELNRTQTQIIEMRCKSKDQDDVCKRLVVDFGIKSL